jgi:hypothetical protein
MGTFDLYSKRQKASVDIFTYDPITEKLRVQIKYIIEDFISKNNLSKYTLEPFWNLVYEALTREHGLKQLYYHPFGDIGDHQHQVIQYLLGHKETEQVLDAIEASFRAISKFEVFLNGTPDRISNYTKEDAIMDLNTRFKENGIGYRFESGVIVKADNELLHQEITKPTLTYLIHPVFRTINEEYLKAHEHFRDGNFKECLNECLKSFETTLKVICTQKNWKYDPKDTSSRLIQIVFDEGLIPSYLQTKLKSLRSTLESGIPTIRNRNSGHGQGPTQITVDEILASYCLNLTGSTIKFLLELLDM